MFQIVNVLLVIGAYLLGSIPASVWIGRLFYDMDVRNHGSGNAGATNTFRVLGTKPGLIVFAIDLIKGFLAVNLVHLNPSLTSSSEPFITLQLILVIAAILGHIFPLYVGFKGGKGVATLFGAILGVSVIITLGMAGVFFFILFITRYVSLSSMVAGLSFPVIVILIFDFEALFPIIFSIAIPLMIILTHHKNIERLWQNNESKANLSKFSMKGKK